MFAYQRDNAPLRRAITPDDLGGSALYLLSDLARAVTGEIHYVDCGYNIVAMPRLDPGKTGDEKQTQYAAE
jgi:enoyl-[acyl-carrier protein] reductase I